MTKRAIVHVEIPSVNLEKSGAFYREMFGWKVTPMPEMNYALWEPEEGPGGGFSPVGENSKIGQILIHVDSDDIEADLKKAKALGGSVVKEKTEIPDIGWWGLLKDPAGNTIAVYKSMHPQPAK